MIDQHDAQELFEEWERCLHESNHAKTDEAKCFHQNQVSIIEEQLNQGGWEIRDEKLKPA